MAMFIQEKLTENKVKKIDLSTLTPHIKDKE